jgi:membrane protein DedA with SNARE-associated domain
LLHNLTEFLVSFGPWGILLLSAIDSLGVPLPAAMDFLLIGVAAASARAPHQAVLAAALAVVGSTAGNALLFLAARRGGGLFGSGKPPGPRRLRFQEWFHRYGLLTVFIPALVPVLPLPLKVFVISAGALRTRLDRFVAVVLVARVIRYGGEAYLGLLLGADARGFLTRHGWSLAGAAVVLALALSLLLRLGVKRGEAAL